MAKKKGKPVDGPRDAPGAGGPIQTDQVPTFDHTVAPPGAKLPEGATAEEYAKYLRALARVEKLQDALKASRKDHKKDRSNLLEERLAKAKDVLKAASTYDIEGVMNPPVTPYSTAEDIMTLSAGEAQRDEAIRNEKRALSDLTFQTAQELNANAIEQMNAKAFTDYDLAGRGLAVSSIRDSDLFDIDATAAIRKNFLDTRLATATIDAGSRISAANKAFDDLWYGMDLKAVENVRDINTGYAQEPSTGTFEPPSAGNDRGGKTPPVTPSAYTPNQGGKGQGGKGQGGKGQGGGNGGGGKVAAPPMKLTYRRGA